MAAPFKWYGQALLKIATGTIDLDTDTFKVMLCTSAYTPNQDTHDFRDDVTNEVTGTGYTAGGATVTGMAVTYDAASNQMRVAFNDPTWPSSTITARTAVLYKSRGGAASADELVAYAVNDVDVSSTAATFTFDVPNPALTFTAAA